MADIVAKNFNVGHDFKTSLMAGFETRYNEIRKSDLRCLLRTLL